MGQPRNKESAKTAANQHQRIYSDIELLLSELETNKPLVIELAMGKGQFINNLALNNPDKQFLGIDVKEERCLSAAKKADNNKLANLKIYCGNILHTDFPDKLKSDQLWITFPDPWPKKRHYKRRLINQNNIQQIRSLIKDNGELIFKTDHQGLFEYTTNILTQNGFHTNFTTNDLHNSDFSEKTMTEFETRYVKAGKPIYLSFCSKRKKP